MQPIMNAISDTTTGGATHAAARATRVFRLPLAPRLLALFGVIFLAVITGVMIVGAVLVFTMQWALGLFMMACAGLLGALTGYVWRDLRGKWGLRVVLDTDAVTLDLPAGRSLICWSTDRNLLRWPRIDGASEKAGSRGRGYEWVGPCRAQAPQRSLQLVSERKT
jgi:hypothetical protein